MNTPVISPDEGEIVALYRQLIAEKTFPCVAAKAALSREQIHCFVAGHMACPKDDAAILEFLYDFIDSYRSSDQLYHSASIIFSAPGNCSEVQFETQLWHRLQALSDLDAYKYPYDKRVAAAPDQVDFSFSLKEEAFFIIGLHPNSSRLSRQFEYPTMVFNPHAQFGDLRAAGKYEAMKATVRKRDIAVSGTVNPMLRDFGEASEIYQYSGKVYDQSWQCPLHIKHKK
ncbi:YqcI/YcgG family protein [Segetibacter sp. 3557_3]|uniref:guanitoxin biosynthesis heme-dependent pre-guanitoxin N-hydroxylase GntA n=1 Tax=Segetibacter sp. 3557_3 TaxID=2547429 RepID=UPI001058552A|nr:guanitoxin biosynthesis heme-dependent pre-guanitoxin N-hydroxylase GntA [Segetibacter sp. 3557_3]TDH25158.1 YqcI/YcgG family protein [Segetibacter sp. 3557_3]